MDNWETLEKYINSYYDSLNEEFNDLKINIDSLSKRILSL